MLGFSLGGFLAAAFARAYPDRVDGLFLLGVRQQYPPAELAGVRQALARDPRAFLEYFYRRALPADDDAGTAWFAERLLDDYLGRAGDRALPAGLDALAAQRLDAAMLAQLPDVRLLHGGRDQIAPLAEAQALASPAVPCTVVPSCGHLLPLHPALPGLLHA